MYRNSQSFRKEFMIFLLLFFSGSYFYYSIDYDNTASRLYLVSAVVDFKMLNIDPYATMTTDKSFSNGHYYSNKAIGGPLMAVPFYWFQRQIDPWRNQPPLTPFMRYVIRIFTTTLLFAFLGVVLFRLACQWGAGERRAFLMVLSHGLGSIAIIHSSMFSGHGMAAAFSFFAFAALLKLKQEQTNHSSQSRKNLESEDKAESGRFHQQKENKRALKSLLAALAGLSAGMGALCDYTAMYIAAVLACYALVSRIAPRYILIFIGFGLLCAAVLVAYNWWCFGSPVSFSYNYLVTQQFAEYSKHGLMGITFPKFGPLMSILFSPARGLFAIMPVFLFSVLGLWKMFRHHALRREAWLVFAIVIGYLMINTGFYGWHGGWTYGPRYLVPMLPFLAITMIFAPREPLVFGLCLFFSAAQITCVAVSCPHTPIEVKNPLMELVIPLIYKGYLAESWPRWIGLSNTSAMLLYFVICGLLICFIWMRINKSGGDKIEILSFHLLNGGKRRRIKYQVQKCLENIRANLTIRDWKVALPIVMWLGAIALMLNISHTMPSQIVQHYRTRLLYHLQVKDVIHHHIEVLAKEYDKKRSPTASPNGRKVQCSNNKGALSLSTGYENRSTEPPSKR